MLSIEAASVVSGAIVGGNLILTKKDGTTINAGAVVGATGPAGPAGATGSSGTTGAAGTNGNTILSGSGAPSNTLGNNGDYYVNLTATPSLLFYGPKASGSWPSPISLGGGTGGTSSLDTAFPVTLGVALSDETTTITASTTTAKATIRAPFAFTVTEVRVTSTSSGSVSTTIVNVKANGTTLFSTRPSILIGQKSSIATGSTPAVFSNTTISNDDELTFFIDQIATGMLGVKVWLIGTRAITSGTTTPAAPTSVIGTAGSTTVSLTWNAPSSGTTITQYNIQYSTDGGTSTWSSPPSTVTGSPAATAAIITGLTTGTSYIFRVQAVNASGAGSYGSSGTITPSGSPTAPTSVVATVLTSTTATVSWNIPTSDGGSAITSYTVEKSIDIGVNWTSAAGTITGNSLAATGLVASTPVIFRVRATNAGNLTSANSTSSTSVTPSNGTAPTAPTIGTATATGATTSSLTFTAPASPGTIPGGTAATITSYVIERSTNGGGVWTTASATTSGSGTITASVTGLAATTAYIFRVSATNSAGLTSSVSSSSNSITTSGSGGAQTLTPSLVKFIQSSASSVDFSYSDAQSATQGVAVLPTFGNTFNIGQSFEANSYNIFQGYVEFNTAVGGTTVSAESFKVTITNATNVVTGFTLELYGYDFGATVEAADWRTNTALSSLTLLGSAGVTSSSTGVITLTLSGTALRSYIQSRLSTTSRFVLASSRQRTNTTPTGNERISLNGAACELAFTVA
jgi:titin